MGVNLKRVRTVVSAFEQAGLIVMDKTEHDGLIQTVDRLSEEVDALELRIKRLLKESNHGTLEPPPVNLIDCRVLG